MSTINTNLASLTAMHRLHNNNADLNVRLERLASGLKINTGKDDPAGLIASENMRAQMAGLQQVIDNSSRANSVIGTAEGGLHEISALLVELQSLVVESANSGALSQEEIEADQLQVDSILSSINRIASGTQFGGKKLLDGSLDYTTTGVTAADLSKAQINSAKLTDGVNKAVVVQVTTAAEVASVTYTSAAALAADVTLQITGNKGSETIRIAAGTEVAGMATAINAVKDATGISATTAAAVLTFSSQDWGDDAYVAVSALSGTFTTSAANDYGLDPVVKINGTTAETDGLKASVRSTTLDIDLILTSSFADGVGSSSFNITGGGASFQLSPHADFGGRASIGLPSLSTGSLGRTDIGFLSSLATGGDASLVSGKAAQAQLILDEAIQQVTVIRGRLGAFQKDVLDPNVNAIQVALENVTASESAIRDADFASETAALTRAQILVQANTAVLSMANSTPQSVLALLQG